MCSALEDNAAEFVESYSLAKPINKGTRKGFSQVESIMQDMKNLLTPALYIPSASAAPKANLDSETSSPSEPPNPEVNDVEMMDDQSEDVQSAGLIKHTTDKPVVQD